MSEIEFDPQIPDPPPGATVTVFQTWLAGQAERYQRRLCSCGCLQKREAGSGDPETVNATLPLFDKP